MLPGDPTHWGGWCGETEDGTIYTCIDIYIYAKLKVFCFVFLSFVQRFLTKFESDMSPLEITYP